MTAAMPAAAEGRRFLIFNALLSSAAVAFLAWLMLAHRGAGGYDLRFMPAVNACFNALSASCLVVGWFAIRAGKIQLHRTLMVSAFASSALFLVGYVAYHYVHGDTKFAGQGGIRTLYFAILISHVLLSMTVVPFALAAFYYALRRRFETHARIMRIGLPVWLYVSVTGVAIFLMLRPQLG